MSSLRAILRVGALGGLALAVVGCDTIRQAAGVTKEPPDEFAVVTKSPLVVPPDFNLRPPKPGAVPTNQSSPTQAAQAALFGDDPVTTASALPGNFSAEERIVLANSGGATADHSIRKQIVSDEKATEATEDSFTDALLFSSPDPNKGAPLDADAEAQRIQNAKANGQTVAGSPNATTPAASKQQPKPDDSASIKKDSGGWFDGIF
jgi:Protein of unknown function (DUF3035)